MGYIYKITNLKNNKIYIGQTVRDIEVRWKEHLRRAFGQSNMRNETHLYKSMRKYGKDNFTIDQIEECNNNILNNREKFWIAFYKSNDPHYGYNITLGGDGAHLLNYDEIYKAWDSGLSTGEISKTLHISQSNIVQILKGYKNYSCQEGEKRGHNYMRKTKGTPVSQYDIDGNYIQTFDSSKDASRKVETTTRQNILKCCREKKGLSGGYQWRFEHDEPPEAYIGKRNIPRKVNQYDMNGHFIKTFQSIADASRTTFTDASSIIRCCQEKVSYANNFIWKYYDKDVVI